MVMAEKKQRSKPKFSKVAVVSVLVSVAVFTATMTVIFLVMGAIPDTLVSCFFAFAGGEAGVLGLIKHSDNKHCNGGGSGDYNQGP